jgi:Transposase domain (DUF772)
LGLDGDVPDHSTFSKNRHGRFRESDLLRKLFETVVARCMKEGIVGGEGFVLINYFIDLKHAVIMDVEATTAIRQAEVGAAKKMLDRDRSGRPPPPGPTPSPVMARLNSSTSLRHA